MTFLSHLWYILDEVLLTEAHGLTTILIRYHAHGHLPELYALSEDL
jgi:hypothetical protein